MQINQVSGYIVNLVYTIPLEKQQRFSNIFP